MMRSMFSGVSGLRAHQLKMDTIGNNIANVNTVGYKSQRATFQEVFNQTIRGAGSPQEGKGGTNPQQVGLGISLSSIDTFHIRGAVQRTDNLTDLAINGDGFFILSNSDDGMSRSYTRAGNFSLDESGNLVASNGYKVLGYMMDPTTNTLKSQLEGVKISKAEMVAAKATKTAGFEGNLDNNIVKAAAAITIADNVAAVDHDDSVTIPAGTKFWETTSNFYDSLGGKHTLKFTFVRGVEPDGTVDAATDADWGVLIYDQDQQKYYRYGNAGKTNMGIRNDDTSATVNDNTTSILPAAGAGDFLFHMRYGTNGLLNAADAVNTINGGKMTLNIPGKNGAAYTPVDIDFAELTQFANESNAAVTSSDGYPQGSLDTFSIGPTGEVSGIFTNGMSKIIGQVALSVFKNPAGLEKTSENMYQVTPNSGDPITGLPGSSGLGSINSGTLEMSNVDISNEFAEMISTQRGFQANSRIITTSDEMLQELVNLKR